MDPPPVAPPPPPLPAPRLAAEPPPVAAAAAHPRSVFIPEAPPPPLPTAEPPSFFSPPLGGVPSADFPVPAPPAGLVGGDDVPLSLPRSAAVCRPSSRILAAVSKLAVAATPRAAGWPPPLPAATKPLLVLPRAVPAMRRGGRTAWLQLVGDNPATAAELLFRFVSPEPDAPRCCDEHSGKGRTRCCADRRRELLPSPPPLRTSDKESTSKRQGGGRLEAR